MSLPRFSYGKAYVGHFQAIPHFQAHQGNIDSTGEQLQRLMLDHQLARYEIYAVYKQKQYTPYVQRAFLSWFKSYLAE